MGLTPRTLRDRGIGSKECTRVRLCAQSTLVQTTEKKNAGTPHKGDQPQNWRATDPRTGQAADIFLNTVGTCEFTLRVVAKSATRTQGDFGGHGSRLRKGMTLDTGESCP